MEQKRQESPLEMARRHVREAEARVEKQVRIIAELQAHGHNTSLAEHLLVSEKELLGLARRHLKIEEVEAEGQPMPARSPK